MPRAVRGLTKHDAPSAGAVPSGSARQRLASARRYSAYIEPPRTATVRPIRAWAAADEPAATTTPAPSLPVGIVRSRRPATCRANPLGMSATATGPCSPSAVRTVETSAGPNSTPRSEGLIGDASTRMTTSSGPGWGTGTLSSASSTVPPPVSFARIVE